MGSFRASGENYQTESSLIDRRGRKNNRQIRAIGLAAAQPPVGRLTTSNELINLLPSTLLRKLEPYVRTVGFSGEKYVYRPDDEIEWVYFPDTAVFSELKIHEDGRTVEVAMTGREGAIGITAAFYPATAANWVQVTAPGTALRIMSEPLNRWAGHNDQAISVFHRALASHIRQISYKAACSAHHSIKERFCTWLLMLSDRSGGGRLKLTHEQCARALGVYRPSITFMAQELRRSGHIDYVRGYIVIKNRDQMKRICCECYFDLGYAAADRIFRAKELERVA